MRILLPVLIVPALILSSAFLVAQEAPLKGPNRDPNPEASRPKTYQGCVIKSNGQVMLTDRSNKDYRLLRNSRSQGTAPSAGEARSLESYVGQEVRITASTVNPSDPSLEDTSVSSQTPPNRSPTLDVEAIAKVADHCSSPK